MFKTHLIIFIFLFSNLFFLNNSKAIIVFEDHAFPELVTSGRALAMGNTYASKVDDGWAAFYNPAGLGSVRGLQFYLFNLHLEVNDGLNNSARNGGVSFSESVTNFASAFTASGARDLLADLPGTSTHARTQAYPNITFRGFSLGYMYSMQNKARLMEEDSDLELAERLDQGPVGNFSISFFGGILKVGASAISLTRRELFKDFAPTDDLKIKKIDYKYGSMTLVTGGMRLTLPIWALPTLSYVVRNSTQASFSGEDDKYGGLPDDIPQTADVGASITPQLGKVFRMHLEVTAKDQTNKYENFPASRKLGYGVEFDFMRAFFVRFGNGDGWGSAGVGVRSNSFIFDLTTYSIEQTRIDEEGEIDDSVKKKQDRRFLMSISNGF